MEFEIAEIRPWVDHELPRIAVIKDRASNLCRTVYLFPHVNNMVAAIGVDDELTTLNSFYMLLSCQSKNKLADWTIGDVISFPF